MRHFGVHCPSVNLHSFIFSGSGFEGNLISFLVFICTPIRQLSSSVYLAGLALSDSGFLLQLFVTWLGYVRVFLVHQNIWCQTVVYVTYVCSFLSVWLVVAFTFERYIAVSIIYINSSRSTDLGESFDYCIHFC